MMSDAIAHISDADRVTSAADPIGFPVGICAVDGMERVGMVLDGLRPEQRPAGRFSFAPHGLDFDRKALAVRSDWQAWWDGWRANGPQR